MAHQTEIPRITGHDWHHDCGCWTSFSYASQNVGTGDADGLVSPFNRTSITPGSIDDSDNYVRTDLSSHPQIVQDLLSGIWTDSFHISYEALLRA